MKFESLIFDIDGTLWDSRALVAEGYNIQLHAEGLDHLFVNADMLRPLFGKVREEIANVLFASLPEAERDPLMIRCMDAERIHMAQQPCRIAFPGVEETLEKLAKKYRLFIVSNSERGYPELCMEKLGISHLFSGHLCFGDTRTCKGETIRRLMETHSITSACYIGDTQGDRDATVLADLPFVYCAFGFGQVDGYWKKIDKFEDLLNIF